jgi:eukaryotic-like serine/threonine-protein kinase
MKDHVRYESIRPAGIGGMATVYLGEVEENGTKRPVAIKRLHDFVAEDPANLASFRNEARLVSCIHHKNVVEVLDLIEDGERPALVLEWVEGMNLAALSALAASKGRALPLDVVAAIVHDVLSGLEAAHEARREDGVPLEIVHRDVSPQNILVGVDGVTRLTDFGVAKARWRVETTTFGEIKGKLGYMAPEQLDGRADRRSDLYSAGVVLWELLTGKRFRNADALTAHLLVQIVHGLCSRPSEHAPDVAYLDAFVMRALARDADDRFETAQAMAKELTAIVRPASAERVAEVVASLIAPEMTGTDDVASPAHEAISPRAATREWPASRPSLVKRAARIEWGPTLNSRAAALRRSSDPVIGALAAARRRRARSARRADGASSACF